MELALESAVVVATEPILPAAVQILPEQYSVMWKRMAWVVH